MKHKKNWFQKQKTDMKMHEKIPKAFSILREMMDDFDNWYPYNENDTEEDKQGAFNINNMLEGK